jgi:hypothetical protein
MWLTLDQSEGGPEEGRGEGRGVRCIGLPPWSLVERRGSGGWVLVKEGGGGGGGNQPWGCARRGCRCVSERKGGEGGVCAWSPGLSQMGRKRALHQPRTQFHILPSHLHSMLLPPLGPCSIFVCSQMMHGPGHASHSHTAPPPPPAPVAGHHAARVVWGSCASPLWPTPPR